MTLEPHPELSRLRRAAALLRPAAAPWAGTVYRSASPRWARAGDLVAGFGARIHGGRWNPPGVMRAVYGSATPETALAESLAQVRAAGFPDADALPRTLCAIECSLAHVLDLTDGRLRRRLIVSRARMVGSSWQRENDRGRMAVTQALGLAVFEAGFEGLLVPSAADRVGVNLIVFPDRVQATSVLAVAAAPR